LPATHPQKSYGMFIVIVGFIQLSLAGIGWNAYNYYFYGTTNFEEVGYRRRKEHNENVELRNAKLREQGLLPPKDAA